MNTPKPQRGRPPTPPDQKLEHFSIRITAAQRAKIEAQGLAWLRDLIDRAKVPQRSAGE